MSRIAIPSYEDQPSASQAFSMQYRASWGSFPISSSSSAAVRPCSEGLIALNGALGRTLDVRTRERIAIAVAEATGCDYCLSVHSFLAANMAGLDADEIAANRAGHSLDARADAAVVFARAVVRTRGKVDGTDISAVKLAGFSDAQVIEIVANVAINVFTNLTNNVAQTDIDFPIVRAGA
jgi:uncharacterized peroxidase-related enzyme